MKCAWQELLSILPSHIRQALNQNDCQYAQEIRLRQDKPVEVVAGMHSRWLTVKADSRDLTFVINTASQYSPWSAATVSLGYITAAGGHRIGICGECVIRDGEVTGVRNVTSVCIRVARDITAIAPAVDKLSGSVLILGPPGSGKTTLLRDLIRNISNSNRGCIAVIDQRGELFPVGCHFDCGNRTDVLTGCSKPDGVNMALRTMGPKWIAVDEITEEADCAALLQTGWCGVRLLATAHAADKEDLMERRIYRPLAQCGLFDTLLILRPDMTWRMERVRL